MPKDQIVGVGSFGLCIAHRAEPFRHGDRGDVASGDITHEACELQGPCRPIAQGAGGFGGVTMPFMPVIEQPAEFFLGKEGPPLMPICPMQAPSARRSIISAPCPKSGQQAIS